MRRCPAILCLRIWDLRPHKAPRWLVPRVLQNGSTPTTIRRQTQRQGLPTWRALRHCRFATGHSGGSATLDSETKVSLFGVESDCGTANLRFPSSPNRQRQSCDGSRRTPSSIPPRLGDPRRWHPRILRQQLMDPRGSTDQPLIPSAAPDAVNRSSPPHIERVESHPT